MMGFLRKLVDGSEKATAMASDPTEELEASHRARIDIRETLDQFIRDGEAEQARQAEIRKIFRGELLMDDLFGPNPRGGQR